MILELLAHCEPGLNLLSVILIEDSHSLPTVVVWEGYDMCLGSPKVTAGEARGRA